MSEVKLVVVDFVPDKIHNDVLEKIQEALALGAMHKCKGVAIALLYDDQLFTETSGTDNVLELLGACDWLKHRIMTTKIRQAEEV
jgi:hypothetical protein